MNNNFKRDFKGVWIPKEIWLNPDLSIIEKCLLVEIDSLDNDPEKGCFASNEYLSKFIGKSEGRTANIVSDLRKRGFIETVFWDGRKRGLRLRRESSLHENVKADFTEINRQPSQKRESSLHKNVNILIQSSNTDKQTISENRVQSENKIKQMILEAGKGQSKKLPPEERMIQNALLKGIEFFKEYPHMVKHLMTQARIKKDDKNFVFFHELENWIRYNGDSLPIMTNTAKHIPSKFGRWLMNYKTFNKSSNTHNHEKTGTRKNKHLISAEDACDILTDLVENGI